MSSLETAFTLGQVYHLRAAAVKVVGRNKFPLDAWLEMRDALLFPLLQAGEDCHEGFVRCAENTK
jgi:hypothetical protein